MTSNWPGLVSPGLESDQLQRLRGLLGEFHRQHNSLADDEIARFTYLCDSMFTTFTSRNRNRVGDTEIDWLPPGGNLDTGDSAFLAPSEALEVLTERRQHEAALARYIGPECDPLLTEALQQFLVAHSFDLAHHLDVLGITVACGTVTLFDAICRDLIQQPGDTVLMPSIGYGFFIAQPYRAGGRVDVVPCSVEGRVNATELAQRIETCNARLYREWWPRRHHHVHTGLHTAGRRGLIRLPEDDEHLKEIVDALADRLDRCPSIGREEIRNRFAALGPLLSQSDCSLARDPRRDPHELIRPPRVLALLHINPGVTGCRYTGEQTAAIAEVLTRHEIVAIEDLAYHSIRIDGSSVRSLQGLVPRCHTLFGLSKPFSLANLRVGVMLVAAEDVKRIERLIENSIGFVSLMAQRAAAAALCSHGDSARTYLTQASNNPEHGYQIRLEMFLAMLRGTAEVQRVVSETVESRIRGLALDLLTAKRAVGSDVTGDPLLDESLVREFLHEGLSKWFTLPFTPEAGFFAVVSCRPLLRSGLLKKIGIESPCAFDVFAFLAYALGVRTIPEEGMRTHHTGSHLLRMAFSPTPKILVESLFTTYLALRHLETRGIMEDVS